MNAYRAGNVTLANAVGTGVADDKAIYPFVEDMIRFYLSEEPILQNVPTYICARRDDRRYVARTSGRAGRQGRQRIGRLRHADGAVVHGRGADEFRDKIQANPRNYIAQPVVTLSTCPTWTEEGLAPRHVDLRPYIVSGKSTWVLPGGLTRTALVKGSLVVNPARAAAARIPGSWRTERLQTRGTHGRLQNQAMISRVAEHCFWMSRYLERPRTPRASSTSTRPCCSTSTCPLEQQWKPLLIISGIHDMPANRTPRRCRIT